MAMKIVKTHTREQLEQTAHELYREQYGAEQAPRVINTEAVLALGQPRLLPPALLGRGRYRLLPPSFMAGYRLYVIAQLLEAGNADAARLARRALHALIQRRGLWWRRPARNPCRHLAPAHLAALCHFVLHLPIEEADTPPASGTIDVIDGLTEMAHTMRGWIGRDGLPISWHHYQVAMRYMHRIDVRGEMRFASATRVAFGANETEWKNYIAQLTSSAGAH